MPIFEIEGPDGTYEVDAPDERAAVAAFKKMQGGGESSPMNALAASNVGALSGLTANFGDEIMAGLMTPIEMGIGAVQGDMPGLGEAYTSALEKNRAYEAQARQEHPIAATAGDVGGALATGGTLAKGGATLLQGAKPTLGSMAGRGAAEGSLYGGAYGAGAGEGLDDRLARAGTGAAVGGALGGAVGALGARGAQKAARKTIPTTENLKEQATALYDKARQSGAAVSRESFGAAVDDIAQAARDARIDAKLHPKASAALGHLQKARSASGQFELDELENFRRVLGDAASSPEAGERRIAKIMLDQFDEYQTSLTPRDLVSGDKQAIETLGQARSVWSRMKKSELIDDAIVRAERQAASTGSGGNTENAIRQNIKSILNNPKKARGFTKEERDAMEKIVRGAKGQDLIRLIGKLSPQGSGLMAALGLGSTAVNPLMAIPYAAGAIAKPVATGMTQRNVGELSDIVRSGGQLPQPQQLSGPVKALLEALLIEGGQQGANIPVLSGMSQ